MLKIEKFSKDFSAVKFVLAARGSEKDYGKVYIELVHIEKDNGKTYIVATDGCRMHVAVTDTEWAPGDYTVTVNTAKMILLQEKTDVIFPNWRRVFPYYNDHWGEYEKIIDNFSVHDKKDMIARSNAIRDFYRSYNGGINIEYLLALEENTFEVWQKTEKPENHPVCFIGTNLVATNLHAVIMPYSLE